MKNYSYKKELIDAIQTHNATQHMQICIEESDGKFYHYESADGYLDRTDDSEHFTYLLDCLLDAVETYIDPHDENFVMPLDLRRIHRLHDLVDRNLFSIDAALGYDRLSVAITKLADATHALPHDDDRTEFIWSIGEHSSASLDSLMVGAYWHYSEGNSDSERAAYNALSNIFTPGFGTQPDPDTCECDVYNALEQRRIE